MIPKYIHVLMMQSFKGNESFMFPMFYIVENEKLQKWLVKNIGIYSDSPIIEKGNFKVKYNWNIQRFMIGA